MIKGAIFDMDGTLLDSMYVWSTIGERYIRSLGYEPKDGLNERIKTMTLQQAAHLCREEYGIPISEEDIVCGVNRMAEHYYVAESTLKEGIEEFLEKLRLCGVKMCVATVTDRHLAEAALKRCGIREYFSEVFTCAEIGHGKDEPIIYRKAMGHLQTDKKNTVVFEDSFYAVETSVRDNFITVAVYDIYEQKRDEAAAMADFSLKSFTECDDFWKFAAGI